MGNPGPTQGHTMQVQGARRASTEVSPMRARGSRHGTLAAILNCDTVGLSQMAQLYLD